MDPDTLVWLNLAIAGGLMVLVWLISIPLRDASIIDIAWGMGFVVIAWTTFALADGATSRKLLLAILTTIWGCRLAAYLAWRKRGEGEDRRYAAMRARMGSSFPLVSLPLVFGVQAIGMWTVSLPVQVAMMQDTPSGLVLLDYVGVALWLVGLFFESVGDGQLVRFKADPANAGRVMDRGLWRYTRHPNYFGDFMVWWGLYAIALATGDAWWTIIGPVLMTVLLLRVSGVTLLEKTIGERRPGYLEYARRTSAFFPRPPRA